MGMHLIVKWKRLGTWITTQNNCMKIMGVNAVDCGPMKTPTFILGLNNVRLIHARAHSFWLQQNTCAFVLVVTKHLLYHSRYFQMFELSCNINHSIKFHLFIFIQWLVMHNLVHTSLYFIDTIVRLSISYSIALSIYLSISI